MNDPVTKVKGVSEAKAELLGANGIMTVQDLVDLGEDRDAFNAVFKTTKGLGNARTPSQAKPLRLIITSMIHTPTGQSMEKTRMSGVRRSDWWK